MPGCGFHDDRDECGLAKDRKERLDALLAAAYRNGRAAGLHGLGTSGRPEDDEESREWLKGYRSGLADYLRRRAA